MWSQEVQVKVESPQPVPAPPGTPQPAPAPTTVELPGGGRVVLPGGASPRQVYQAAREKREVIRDLIERARNRRAEVASQLRNTQATGADREGLEARIKEMDARIIDLEKQLIAAENEMTAAAGIPGAVTSERMEGGRSGPPEEIFIILPVLLTIFVLFPIAFAYSRRIWKRTGMAVAAIPSAVTDRLARLEQAVDAIAIEVERISEGQRFMTKLFSDGGNRALGQGAAQPIEVPARERAAQG